MNNIGAVFWKQIKETFKNKAVLIQFVMFPILTVIMEKAIKLENMPEHFFAKLFAVMFVGMSPITCMSSIISEEKEKNTLRALMMSNVHPAQYLVGVGAYIWICCMAGTAVIAVCGGFAGIGLVLFMAVMALGILLSILVGAVIGIACKNQMAATSITVPVMLAFSILPMLAMFNDSIKKIASVTYSWQMSVMINDIGSARIESKSIIVIAVNLIIVVALFAVFYKKRGLE